MNQDNYGKSVKITAPEGYEIDTVNSTSNEIVFKKVKLSSIYPMDIKDILNRKYYISLTGHVNVGSSYTNHINNLSSMSRAKAFLALMQLVELRDAWQKVDNKFTSYYDEKFTIIVGNNPFNSIIMNSSTHSVPRVLAFSLRTTRDKFAETFKDLIEEAKELL